jgi:hypothetical protein
MRKLRRLMRLVLVQTVVSALAGRRGRWRRTIRVGAGSAHAPGTSTVVCHAAPREQAADAADPWNAPTAPRGRPHNPATAERWYSTQPRPAHRANTRWPSN